ncbi:MAG TPA: SOS response-associated peptidase family protein [Sphingobium sp.]|nr:SOS response-associated peptidase family protein [Sphingobium sp.]
MTHLYRLDATAAETARRFGAEAGDDPWVGGYAAPGRFAPVIIGGAKGGRFVVPRLWGVPPPISVTATDARPITSVRNTASPFWIGNLRHTSYRCLVPATAFQLWAQGKDPATGRSVAHWFSLAATPLFAFAGIWRDSEVPSFAILACEANRLIASVNPVTMPLILHAEDHERWLRADWRSAQALVTPFPSQLMQVSRSHPLAMDQ